MSPLFSLTGSTTSTFTPRGIRKKLERYLISRSLRFDGSSSYLSYDPPPNPPENHLNWTFSAWIKRSRFVNQRIFTAGANGTNCSMIQFAGTNNNQFEVWNYQGGTHALKRTTQQFNDNNWHHFVVSCTTSTLQIYVDGVEATYVSSPDNVNPDGTNWSFGQDVLHALGKTAWGTEYFDGYMADVDWHQGETYDPSYYGEFVEGVWLPKEFILPYTVITHPTYTNNWLGIYQNNNPPIVLGRDKYGVTRNSSINFGSSVGVSWTSGDTLMWAWDADNSRIWLGHNGTWYASGDPGNNLNPVFAGFDATVNYYFQLGYSADPGNATLTTKTSAQATYSVPSGFTYWTGTDLNWANSGTSTSLGTEDYIAQAMPTTGKVYFETTVTFSTFVTTFGFANFSSSFHLSFPVDTSLSIVSNDTSGNGNIWQGNNITYTSGSNIVYSRGLSTDGSWGTNQGPEKAFNGDPRIDEYNDIAYGGVGTTITWTASKVKNLVPPNVTTLTLYVYNNAAGESKTFTINGSSASGTVVYTPPVETYGVYGYQFTVNGQVNSFTYQNSSGGSTRLRRVVFDSNLAVDRNKSSIIDSPSKGTQPDTGLGGQVTGDYCTLNPNYIGTDTHNTPLILSNGGLAFNSNQENRASKGTILVSSGKWYWEVVHSSFSSTSNSTGACVSTDGASTVSARVKGVLYRKDGVILLNDANSGVTGATFDVNDVIGIALDIEQSQVTFYKNGVLQGTVSFTLTGTGTATPIAQSDNGSGSLIGEYNFGQMPFEFPSPSGFKCLCSANL